MIVDNESVVSECYLVVEHITINVVEHITINLDDIYLGVIIANPIGSLCLRTNAIAEGSITTTLTGKVIQTLIIVDPECNIPGLIILPPIVGNVESIGLIGGAHCVVVVLTL